MFEPAVEIVDIMKYVGACERPFIEGSAILKSKHLMTCGLVVNNDERFKVLGLCLQSSALDGKPHEIFVTVEIKTAKIIGTCSCKAGSGKCKHIVAVLLFLNRQALDSLEDLSCTDMTQQWGKLKASAKSMYTTRPARQFCHPEPYVVPVKHRPHSQTPEARQAIMALFLSEVDSALTVNLVDNGARSSSTSPSGPTPAEEVLALSMVISSNALLQASPSADTSQLVLCPPEERQLYNESVALTANKAAEICAATISQAGESWLSKRRVRITGSRAYEIHTYASPSTDHNEEQWEKKFDRIFFEKFSGNKHTTYGKLHEKPALAAYQRQTGHKVTDLGFIVNVNSPWLGYSPDGVTKDRLLEVKCLVAGKTLGGLDMARSLKCVKVIGEKVVMEKRNKYYGQVQLGLLLTGLDVCDFLLYSKLFDNVLIVTQKYDAVFCSEMIHRLRSTYFKRILPYLVRNKHKLTQQ